MAGATGGFYIMAKVALFNENYYVLFGVTNPPAACFSSSAASPFDSKGGKIRFAYQRTRLGKTR